MASGEPEDRLRRLEQRMEQLLEVTVELAAAADEEAIARSVVHKGIAALGASYGGLWLLDPAKQLLVLVAVTALPRGSIDRWTAVPLDFEAPLPQAVRSGEPIFIASLADYRTRFPDSFERMRSTISSPDASYVMLPVPGETGMLGGLAMTFERANAIGTTERAYLGIVVRQCALALDRVRQYAKEHALRLAAEDATRAREEILSVVSHDLRNPLGTISVAAQGLQHAEPDPKRVHAAAGRIAHQAERMARLIEDLVDFAGIQAGKLAIERRPTSPAAILGTALDLFAPMADERRIAFAVEGGDLPPVDCDPDRVVQLLSNLVGNSIKVTPVGGAITVGATAAPDHGEVVFYVRDTGPGIEAEELPRLFERYWRSKKATYKGAGLGLSIARGIVDAHGGRIWAESRVGASTTFFFTLTPHRSTSG